MTEANFSRTSPPQRTSSVHDLLHRQETHPQNHHLANSIPRPSIDSDDGSQQERNHQQPRPISNPPRLPRAPDVSGNMAHASGDTSPKHPYRKRKLNDPTVPHIHPDLSSLTQKPEDHASSVAPLQQPTPLGSAHRPEEEHVVDKFTPAGGEGSTEVLPTQNSALLNHDTNSPTKQRRRLSAKAGIQRTELLEENRALRIELDRMRYRLRKVESNYHKQKKELQARDQQISKYRTQLINLFESGEGDLFQVNKPKYATVGDDMIPSASPEAGSKREEANNSKGDDDSVSQSGEEGWSSYSAPSQSMLYDDEQDKSEDLRRRRERDPCTRSEATIRKHRRTRAPAWTQEEEVKFMEAYKKHGCRWKMFQDSLPRRSRRQIQSHGSYLIRQGKLSKKNSRPWQRRKPRPDGPSSSVREVDMEDVDASDRE